MADTGPDPKALERAQRKAIDGYRRDCLRRLIRWARRTVFYRRHLSNVRKGNSIRDLQKLPFTTKDDLFRSMGPVGRSRFSNNCWCHTDKLAFIGQTGGPGTEALAEIGHRPLSVPMRPVDMYRRASVAARAFRMALRNEDGHLGHTAILHEVSSSIVHQAILRGLISLHARPMTLGRGSTARRVHEDLSRLAPENLVTYPTYAAFLRMVADDLDVELHFKNIFLWGEVGGSVKHFRDALSKAYDCRVHDIYAMQELGILASECRSGKGLHGFEDQFIYEIVDPSNGDIIDDGQVGELVVTDLHRSAFPLVRYRTGDITSIERARCRCGRTHLRLMGIRGRVSDGLVGEDGRTEYPADMMGTLGDNPHVTGVFRVVPGMGASVETKENKQMADHYLERFGRPPGKVAFERVLPRFPHRTEYLLGPRYERLLKEQIGKER